MQKERCQHTRNAAYAKGAMPTEVGFDSWHGSFA